MLGTLFESQLDRDQDSCTRAVAHAYSILRGDTPDGLKPTYRQLQLLRLVVDRQGRAQAISVGELAERLKTQPRAVKGDVNELRQTFRVRIGSSRDGDAGGYYLITTKDEAFDTVRPFIRQAQAEFAIANAILEPHELAELEGQMRLGEA